jgi:hypothetical protein
MIGGWLGLRLAIAAVAIGTRGQPIDGRSAAKQGPAAPEPEGSSGGGTSFYLARRRKRARAEWRAYDEAHASDRPLRPTGAASRARQRDD